MKTKTKIGLIIIVSMMLLLLSFGQPVVYAGTNTKGGDREGEETAVGKFDVEQDKFDNATRLHFTSCQKDAEIDGWSITIDMFSNSNSTRDTSTRVDVQAWGYTVYRNETVVVDVTHWTEGCKNAMGLVDLYWVEGSQAKAMPDHYWHVDFPESNLGQLGNYTHRFTMINLDDQYNLTLSGLTFSSIMTRYENLSEIIFMGPVYGNFTLNPGQSWTTNITTIGTFIGGYIYFKYDIANLEGSKVVCNAWGGHPVNARPVGGFSVPVDKLALLAPYIALASTILVATAATAIYVKRKKKRQ